MHIREIIEHQVEQGSPEWHNIRTGLITGSNFGILMPTKKQRELPFNKTQLDYLYGVAAEIMTNVPEETFQTFDMKRGSELEPVAFRHYSIKHMVELRTCGIFTDGAFLGSSPDALYSDGSALVEFKCPKQKTHVKYLNNPGLLLDSYLWQVVGECYFTGIGKAFIVSFHPDFIDEHQMIEFEYIPTEEDYSMLESRLAECVVKIQELIK